MRAPPPSRSAPRCQARLFHSLVDSNGGSALRAPPPSRSAPRSQARLFHSLVDSNRGPALREEQVHRCRSSCVLIRHCTPPNFVITELVHCCQSCCVLIRHCTPPNCVTAHLRTAPHQSWYPSQPHRCQQGFRNRGLGKEQGRERERERERAETHQPELSQRRCAPISAAPQSPRRPPLAPQQRRRSPAPQLSLIHI